MKKIALVLMALVLIPFAGCAGASSESSNNESASSTLTVISPFDSTDGNHDNYVAAYTAFEEESGYTIVDESGQANEEWKKNVLARFDEGTQPDVLFYFTGADANKLVENGEVVSLSEIRKEYPEYATNMKDSMIPVSPVNGRQYAVPVNGYWEALYVNTTILAQCGVEVPGSDYSWQQFIDDCQTIKEAGYTPIACSLGSVPHYWFEYCTFNHGTMGNHTQVPTRSDDATGIIWQEGLEDIKDLYERGYFPEATLTMTDDESCQLIADYEAAFLLDGSWKLGWFEQNVENLEDFTVTYAPAQGERKPTDIVGGLSMGYYITKQAWDDPQKRQACVDFIMAMTTNEVVTSFGATGITALTSGTTPPQDANSLTQQALEMLKGVTGTTSAAQDELRPEERDALFANVSNIVQGEMSSADAMSKSLALTNSDETAIKE